MDWIHNYQLFLFDFDGLLVNTEHIHHRAYVKMCADRGFQLNWSFDRYSLAAHYHAEGLRDQIYAEFPSLHAQEPDWNVLYAEKKRAFLHLLKQGAVQLMPGVEGLLKALQQANINRCVVTHSALEIIQAIRQQHSILDTIPNWITREDYAKPKPDPECYETAIARLANPKDAIIGFEDLPRGFAALQKTRAKAILVCPSNLPYLNEMLQQKVIHYPSFEAIAEKNRL